MTRKKIVSLAVVMLLLTVMLLITSCYEYKEELKVYTCGSGFYINRDDNYNYYIDDLNVESNGNSFYLEDYFCSEEFGIPYAISDGIIDMGNVYLAKKDDYYNENIFDFDLDSYADCCIEITPEMNYVNIHSSNTEVSHELFIVIKPRDIPLDITFENVNICTKSAIPVFYSQAYVDVNIRLIGKNTFSTGNISQRSTSVWERLENGLTEIENRFVSAYESAPSYIEGISQKISNQTVLTTITSCYNSLTGLSIDLFTGLVNGMQNIFTGVEGSDGRNGVACFIHAGGVCFTGDGSLSTMGGSGENGYDAKDSMFGGADGGNGGMGGEGFVCKRLLIVSPSCLWSSGGKGGKGGDPSNGLWGIAGSSGKQGSLGRDGKALVIAEPRDD